MPLAERRHVNAGGFEVRQLPSAAAATGAVGDRQGTAAQPQARKGERPV